jgi:tetratricopeptide (TPR) repeat protein
MNMPERPPSTKIKWSNEDYNFAQALIKSRLTPNYITWKLKERGFDEEAIIALMTTIEHDLGEAGKIPAPSAKPVRPRPWRYIFGTFAAVLLGFVIKVNMASFLYKSVPQTPEEKTMAIIEDCDKVLNSHPNDAPTHRKRGLAKYKLEDYAGAILDFNAVIKASPQDAEIYRMRGIAKYYDRSEYAVDVLMPGQSTIHHKVSCQEIRDDLEAALRLNSKDADALCYLGDEYRLCTNEYDKAIECYDQAIVVNPQYAIAYRIRGWTEYELKKYENALADWQTAIQLNPSFKDELQPKIDELNSREE